MGILIDSEDFTGKWKIATDDYSEVELDDYISAYEKKYLVALLGVELYDLFAADLNNQVPQTAIYTSIFNEFYIDDSTCVFHSEGMKKMLLGLIFFQYVRDQDVKNTVSGTVRNQSELAVQIPAFNSVVLRWNQSIDTFRNIQWYICDNETDYPTYNGQSIDYTSGI